MKKKAWIFGSIFVLFIVTPVFGQEPAAAVEKDKAKADFETMKTEWEAVREQQIQMIREKQEQLEKLKEELFVKAQSLTRSAPVSSTSGDADLAKERSDLELQKVFFQEERQKFFVEMNRQKGKLKELEASIDKKTKELDAERTRFEQEKIKAGSSPAV